MLQPAGIGIQAVYASHVGTEPRPSVRMQLSGLADRLTPAERRVADVIDRQPETAAFATAAELAKLAESGVATVVRLAAKLGFDGFSAMQAVFRAELRERLRPAAQRIREPSPKDMVGRTLVVEMENLRATLGAVSTTELEQVAAVVAKAKGAVVVLSSDASAGVARQIVGDLGMLRSNVVLADGNPVALARQVHEFGPNDVCIVLDLRRYETWVVDTAKALHHAGVTIIAFTDGPLSPLVGVATYALFVSADSPGPFDSYVATLALAGALTTCVAGRLKGVAVERLDRLESAWNDLSLLE